MAKPVVRQADLTRVLDALAKRGIEPAAFDVLPSGAVRLHRVPPAANDSGLEGPNEWDAALE